jgi:hypothetical protein
MPCRPANITQADVAPEMEEPTAVGLRSWLRPIVDDVPDGDLS